jgi:hypothetical protein
VFVAGEPLSACRSSESGAYAEHGVEVYQP